LALPMIPVKRELGKIAGECSNIGRTSNAV
jgi:hypothetical protein